MNNERNKPYEKQYFKLLIVTLNCNISAFLSYNEILNITPYNTNLIPNLMKTLTVVLAAVLMTLVSCEKQNYTCATQYMVDSVSIGELQENIMVFGEFQIHDSADIVICETELELAPLNIPDNQFRLFMDYQRQIDINTAEHHRVYLAYELVN
jgi:hypothetical protein